MVFLLPHHLEIPVACCLVSVQCMSNVLKVRPLERICHLGLRRSLPTSDSEVTVPRSACSFPGVLVPALWLSGLGVIYFHFRFALTPTHLVLSNIFTAADSSVGSKNNTTH